MCSGRLFTPLTLPSGAEGEPELRRDHHLIDERRERFADQFLVVPVRFCGIEERDAALDRPTHTAIMSALDPDGPNPRLIPMQPRPIAETSSVPPRMRLSMSYSFYEAGRSTSAANRAR